MPVRARSSYASASPTLALCRWPKASASPTSLHLGAVPDRALGGDDERVVTRVVAVVGGEQRRERVQVVRRLGDDAPRGRDVGRVQRGEPGVATEDAEDADPLVAAERRALPVDGLLGPRDGGREADAVLGPLDVVVHRLGDRHQRDAGIGEDLRVRQRVVATDRHEDVDAQVGEVVEDERGQVVAVLVGGEPGAVGLDQARPAARPSASSAGSSATCAGSCRPSGRWSGCSSDRGSAGSRDRAPAPAGRGSVPPSRGGTRGPRSPPRSPDRRRS